MGTSVGHVTSRAAVRSVRPSITDRVAALATRLAMVGIVLWFVFPWVLDRLEVIRVPDLPAVVVCGFVCLASMLFRVSRAVARATAAVASQNVTLERLANRLEQAEHREDPSSDFALIDP